MLVTFTSLDKHTSLLLNPSIYESLIFFYSTGPWTDRPGSYFGLISHPLMLVHSGRRTEINILNKNIYFKIFLMLVTFTC